MNLLVHLFEAESNVSQAGLQLAKQSGMSQSVWSFLLLPPKPWDNKSVSPPLVNVVYEDGTQGSVPASQVIS